MTCSWLLLQWLLHVWLLVSVVLLWEAAGAAVALAEWLLLPLRGKAPAGVDLGFCGADVGSSAANIDDPTGEEWSNPLMTMCTGRGIALIQAQQIQQ